jgi:hypothetical protein
MRYSAAAAGGTKQVSFGSSAPHGTTTLSHVATATSKQQQQQQQSSGNTNNSPNRLGKPVSLNTLDRDCFIIPVTSLDRFLPAGVTVSSFFYILYIIF